MGDRRRLSTVRQAGLQPVNAGSTPADATITYATQDGVMHCDVVRAVELKFPKPVKQQKQRERLRSSDRRAKAQTRIEAQPLPARKASPGPRRETGDTCPDQCGVTAGRDRPLFKQRRYVDEKYKAWVRTQPCLVHGSRCQQQPERDPHHLISVGSGGSDRSCVPLCREVHTRVHKMGLGVLRGQGIDPWYEAWRLNERYEGRMP